MAAAVKRFVASNIKRTLFPLIRPAADSPLMRLKMMTPGGSDVYLPISSLPFFERDYYNRFPLTRRFSGLLLRWTDNYPSPRERWTGEWVNTPECLTIYMNLSGMIPEKVNVCFRHFDDDKPKPMPGLRQWRIDFFVTGDADLTFGYVAPDLRRRIGMFRLPEKIGNYKVSDIKVEIGRNSGELKVTLPKQLNGYVKPTVFNDNGCCFDVNATVIDDR